MTLSAGTRIGPYEVVSPLGAGGMGEVWRARDSRLGREVAVKVLPEALFGDPDSVARFEREARALAALNHPGIAAIHSFEQVSGRHLLVMELVEGEGLDAKVARGALPLDEALDLARQIAEALEAAHEKGIVHRDLKPANVKVTPEGKVKLLDFGLAKALEGDASRGSSPSIAESPTLTARATAAGVILGTAAYMSPEQARGRPVDRRADVWAFGCVLFEMLSGKRAFDGETVSDMLAAVLRSDPAWSALPESTPPAVQKVLRRCLQRDAKLRLRDLGDARLELAESAAATASPATTSTTNRERLAARPLRRLPALAMAAIIAIAAIAAAAAGIAGWVAGGRARTPRMPMRLAIQLPPELVLHFAADGRLAFTPDGSSLVFPGREKGQAFLFRRPLGENVARPISGTEEAGTSFLSPDGRWLGFVAGGKLLKTPAEGGRPLPIAEMQGAGGAAWLADGTLVFAPLYSDGLFRLSTEGAEPQRLTTPDHAAAELGHWWPEPVPGTRWVLFTAFRTPVDRSRIGALDLESRAVHWVVDGGFFARWAPSGHIVYAKGQRLFAAPLDPATATLSGPSVAVLDDVGVSQTNGSALFAISSQGTLAYLTQSLGDPVRQLVWIDRAGKVTTAFDESRRFGTVQLSPDGDRAAVTIQGESLDLWVYSISRRTLSRLTTGEGTEFDARWSKDGTELFYVVDKPPFELHRMAAGVPDSGRPIWNEPAKDDTVGIAVAPDGRTIAFERTEPKTGRNIYWRDLEGKEPAHPFRATRAEECFATFSPDGKWLAYASNDSGRPEVYVEAFPGPGDRFQVSTDGGTEPTWARNSELFFRHNDEIRVVATRTSAAGRFEFDAARTLFSYPITPGNADKTRSWDVAADGSRILAIRTPEEGRPRRIEIVTDWTTELARLAPKGPGGNKR